MDLDLNSDLGEGAGGDAEILPLVSSANISCGFHAGDADSAAEALRLAKKHGVHVGAHPGYPDREHFGRRELDWSPEQIEHLCAHQIGALTGLARHHDVTVRYIKPHGGLYHQACRDERFAMPLIAVAKKFDLPILALPGSRLEALCANHVPFFAEGFADRRYLPDGSLVPRSHLDAFVEDPDEAVAQAERLIRDHHIHSLCVHGDNPRALEFVQHLRHALVARGFHLKAFT